MKQILKGSVMALALALGSAGALSMTINVATAPSAEAFGLGDIGGAIKKAGNGIAKGAKKVGKGIKERAAPMGEALKGTGALAKEGYKGARNLKKGLKNGIKGFLTETAPTCIANGFKCPFNPPKTKPLPQKPINGPGGWGRPAKRERSWGGPNQKVPLRGRAVVNKRQTPALGRDRSLQGRPVSRTRQSAKHDGSRKSLKFTRDLKRSKARPPVHGITRQNLQPNRKIKGGSLRDLNRRGTNRLRLRQTNMNRKQLSVRRSGKRGAQRLDRNPGRKLRQQRDRQTANSRQRRRR